MQSSWRSVRQSLQRSSLWGLTTLEWLLSGVSSVTVMSSFFYHSYNYFQFGSTEDRRGNLCNDVPFALFFYNSWLAINAEEMSHRKHTIPIIWTRVLRIRGRAAKNPIVAESFRCCLLLVFSMSARDQILATVYFLCMGSWVDVVWYVSLFQNLPSSRLTSSLPCVVEKVVPLFSSLKVR